MNLYNIKHLKPPPSSSCKLQNQEINIHELNGLMTDALNLFSSQIYLNAECKMLHSIVRIYKLRYRTSIAYKQVQKLNRCMRNYLEADYQGLISWFLDLLPTRFESETYFPSRNLLDYFLVRTQGLSKLIVRMLECAKQVYIHYIDKIKLAHGIGMSIVIIAIQARIFIIARYLLQCVCHLYDTLYALRDKVPNVQFHWLPENYDLPKHLLPWLDVDWVYKEHQFDLKGRNRDLFSIDLFDADEDDVQFCKEYAIIDDEDDDLQIVNEYLNVLDSDEENPVSGQIKTEMDDDLKLVNDEIRNAFVAKNRKIRNSPAPVTIPVINLDDEIGEPLDVSAKVQEVKAKLEDIKSLDDAEKFIKDRNHTYFQSLGKIRYNHLLGLAQMHKAEGKTSTKKERKALLKEVKEKILQIIETY